MVAIGDGIEHVLPAGLMMFENLTGAFRRVFNDRLVGGQGDRSVEFLDQTQGLFEVGKRRAVLIGPHANVRSDPAQQVIAGEESILVKVADTQVALGVAGRPDGLELAAADINPFAAGEQARLGHRKVNVLQRLAHLREHAVARILRLFAFELVIVE